MDRTAKKTAANLLKLLREDGPTPIDSILKSYQARFRENLNMQGLGIHGSLAAGLLPGIVYRKQNNVGYLAAETTRRTGAAGGGLANSAEMANSRAKDPAVSGLLVVADLESYAAALEKFMLRTEKVTVKTLEQACAGRTVGLRVVQEDLDKTTGALTHIQVANESATVISFDLLALRSNDTENTVSRDLCEFLGATSIMKVTHDVARISAALKLQFGTAGKLVSVIDTQLAYEALGQGVFASVRDVRKAFNGQEEAPYLAAACRTAKFGEGNDADARASKMPEADGKKSTFEVLELVPRIFREELLSERHTENLDSLQELVLDVGARPMAQLKDRGRVYLCSHEGILVTQEDIDMIVGDLDLQGRIGDDNRAGFPGQLHRLSVLRDKTRRIYGVTLRIGRFFRGSAGIVEDLLFYPVDVNEDTPKKAPSILILGEPGSGKTTVIRDISRKLSMSQTVAIVDTSNEIAGDGAIPHREAIGHSRRLMVPSKDHQHRVMIEALQNHTPQTIVVDELSNTLEAKACMDIKARGVRLVASAHGDLQSLLSNPAMNTLVGGKESITLGDALAQKSNDGQKVRVQRAGAPIFDTIIQLKRGEVNTWTIIQKVGLAVDAILNGEEYDVQRRVRIEDKPQAPKVKGAVYDDDVSFFMQLDKEKRKSAVYY